MLPGAKIFVWFVKLPRERVTTADKNGRFSANKLYGLGLEWKPAAKSLSKQLSGGGGASCGFTAQVVV